MADLLLLNVSTVPRRPANFLLVNDEPTALLSAYSVVRRAPPSVPQFSGTLSPARIQKVSLQRRNQSPTETAVSDVNGYFEFTGWYSPFNDYEFMVHGDDLYEAKIFVVDVPVEHRWNGRPDIVDSTDLS